MLPGVGCGRHAVLCGCVDTEVGRSCLHAPTPCRPLHTPTHTPPPHTHTLFPFPPGCHCYWSGVQRDAGEARVWTATTCASSQCSLHARSPVHGPFTPSPWPPTAARMTPPTLIWVAVGGRGGERGGEGHGTPVQAGCACLSSAAALLLLFSPLPCMLHCLFPTAAPPPAHSLRVRLCIPSPGHLGLL